VDEFDLIATYFAPLAEGYPGAHGLADDTALITPPNGRTVIVSADTLVAGVHFFDGAAPEQIAQKALRVNLSDMAAAGATPFAYTLALSLGKANRDEDWIASFARGLKADQKEFGIHLIGGDTTSTPGPLSISLTIFGEAGENGVLGRRGGQAGDAIWVSGTIGDATLALLTAGGKVDADEQDQDYLNGRLINPTPRVQFGKDLPGVATAAIDISDGLAADLGHICRQSGLGAEVMLDRIPLSPSAAKLTDQYPEVLETIVTGGDDYELLFTAPVEKETFVMTAGKSTATAVTKIGVMVGSGPPKFLDAHGELVKFEQTGFRHL